MATTNFQTVDEYIASFPKDTQVALEKVRQTIKDAAPDAQEKISYQMPTFTLAGTLVYFAGFKNHIGMYRNSGALETFKEELAPYIGAKSSLRFPLDKPLPVSLIHKVVKFRVKENLENAKKV
ncbi:MAG TPA: DUF1801 domain-containing protein [Chloroflexota bacterium]|nr:DUF1801 domain-containing protein [Chloroflexota bacterium]